MQSFGFFSVINFKHAGFSVMYNYLLLYFADVEKSTEIIHDLKLKVGWKKKLNQIALYIERFMTFEWI